MLRVRFFHLLLLTTATGWFVFPLHAQIITPNPSEMHVSALVSLMSKSINAKNFGSTITEQKNQRIDPVVVEEVKRCGVKIRTQLKWQNSLGVRGTLSQLSCVESLSCVKNIRLYPKRIPTILPDTSLGLNKQSQISSTTSSQLHQIIGFTSIKKALPRHFIAGKGMRVAVIDNGFTLNHRYLSHLSNQIKDRYDFVDDTVLTYTSTIIHGSTVLALIVGAAPRDSVGFIDTLGLMPGAEILLYRAESDKIEDPYEEDLLAAAIERAVDSGAQVISISLGYRYDFDSLPAHPYTYIDGKSSPASMAASMAASRGVILTISMGNENMSQSSPNITVPADAEGVLSIAALTDAGEACAFSSIGPTFDQREKPELGAPGCPAPVINTSGGLSGGNGTSFSTPIIAGAALLLMQLFPLAQAEEIKKALIETAAQKNYDPQTGHGMIRLDLAYAQLHKGHVPTPPSPYLVWSYPYISNYPLQQEKWDMRGKTIPSSAHTSISTFISKTK